MGVWWTAVTFRHQSTLPPAHTVAVHTGGPVLCLVFSHHLTFSLLHVESEQINWDFLIRTLQLIPNNCCVLLIRDSF